MYTETDLRKAFQAGVNRGIFLEKDEYDPFVTEFDEDDYILSLNSNTKIDNIISFTYSFLRRKLDWVQFCDLTGIEYYAKSNGYEVEGREIFDVSESKAKEYNLI